MLLHELLKDRELILASGSPRRRELLEAAHIPFRIAAKYGVEECYPEDLAPDRIPLYLSRLKSEAYPEPLTEGQILLTADTIVIADDRVLGKPTDADDAVRILSTLSGKSHRVVTGVTLRSISALENFSETAHVTFRALSPEEIRYYVATCRPFDKAGAYGIQEWIGAIGITRIEGSYHNIMGLPIQTLYTELIRFIQTR